MSDTRPLAINQIRTYIAFGGVRRVIAINEVVPNIKNGRDGFEGVVLEGPDAGMEVWGYTRQLV